MSKELTGDFPVTHALRAGRDSTLINQHHLTWCAGAISDLRGRSYGNAPLSRVWPLSPCADVAANIDQHARNVGRGLPRRFERGVEDVTLGECVEIEQDRRRALNSAS